jgi:hypothetical protein
MGLGWDGTIGCELSTFLDFRGVGFRGGVIADTQIRGTEDETERNERDCSCNYF